MNRLAFFNQICMDIILGHDEKLIRFWWPWPNCQGNCRTQTIKFKPKVLVCMLSQEESLAGMLPNLHVYIIGAHHRMVCVVSGHLFSLKTLLYVRLAFQSKNWSTNDSVLRLVSEEPFQRHATSLRIHTNSETCDISETSASCHTQTMSWYYW